MFQKFFYFENWKLLVKGGKKYLFNLNEDVSEFNHLAATQLQRVMALAEKPGQWDQEVSEGVTSQI